MVENCGSWLTMVDGGSGGQQSVDNQKYRINLDNITAVSMVGYSYNDFFFGCFRNVAACQIIFGAEDFFLKQVRTFVLFVVPEGKGPLMFGSEVGWCLEYTMIYLFRNIVCETPRGPMGC